jgi:hypothetical protein
MPPTVLPLTNDFSLRTLEARPNHLAALLLRELSDGQAAGDVCRCRKLARRTCRIRTKGCDGIEVRHRHRVQCGNVKGGIWRSVA